MVTRAGQTDRQKNGQRRARQSQSYKFKEFAKTSNFLILNKTLHTTHLLKSLDKMCEYEMDSAILWKYRAHTILYTDGQDETSIPPSTSVSRRYNNVMMIIW